MSEYVTLVDKHDNVIGSKSWDQLTDNDRWRIVSIWITNSSGDVLIAQRAYNLASDPGKWGPAAAGTVDHGDGYEETARREVFEELGVKPKLTAGKVVFYDSDFGKRACVPFKAKLDLPIDKFDYQTEEVLAIKWINEDELWQDVDKQPGKYIKEFKRVKQLFGL